MTDSTQVGLIFLPDEAAVPSVATGVGPVSALHPEQFIAEIAGAMRCEAAVPPDTLALRARVADKLQNGDAAQWRGCLAAALLAGAFPSVSGTALSIESIDGAGSSLAAAVLRSLGKDHLSLLVLRNSEARTVIGTADDELGIIPAADVNGMAVVLDTEACWYDTRKQVFCDPSPALRPAQRALLEQYLEEMLRAGILAGGETARFLRAMEQTDSERTDAATGAGMAQWQKAVHVIVGLSSTENALDELSYHEHACVGCASALLNAWGIPRDEQSFEPDGYWSWKGTPFAALRPDIGFELLQGEEAAAALEDAWSQEQLLAQHSPAYRQSWSDRLISYTEARRAELLPLLTACLEQMVSDARAAAAVPPAVLELSWPFDITQPALASLLEELLGAELVHAVAQPFSDRLTVVPNGQCDSEQMNNLLSIDAQGRKGLVLPPLSAALAACTVEGKPYGRGVAFDKTEIRCGAVGLIEVTLTIIGQSAVRLKRAYHLSEQFMPESAVECAVWPGVPLPDSRWHAWWLYASGEFSYYVYDHGSWLPISGEHEQPLRTTKQYPELLLVRSGDKSLGVLLSSAQPYLPEESGTAIAGVDIGTSGTACCVSVNGQLSPVEMPALLRTLLHTVGTSNAADWLPGAISAIFPSTVLCGNPSASKPEPLQDASVALQPAALTDEKAESCLMWREDEEGRAMRLVLIREALLFASLHAVMLGAQTVQWRFPYPAAYEQEDIERFRQDCLQAAEWAEETTGLRRMPGEMLRFFRSSAATAQWLRKTHFNQTSTVFFCDIGSATTTLALWVPGIDRPAAEIALDGGIAAYFAPFFQAYPEKLKEDFPVAPFAELHQIIDILKRAQAADSESSASSGEIWRSLDCMYGTHLNETMAFCMQQAQSGILSYSTALMLRGYAMVLTLAGMMLETAADDAVFSGRFPPVVTFELCGRGALPFSLLLPGLRQQLMRFLRLPMRPDHPVKRIQLSMSEVPGQEAALGSASDLLPADRWADHEEVTAANGMDITEHFLLLFHAAFPQATNLLYPGVFDTATGLMTDEAQAAFRHFSETIQLPLAKKLPLIAESLSAVSLSHRMPPSGGIKA